MDIQKQEKKTSINEYILFVKNSGTELQNASLCRKIVILQIIVTYDILINNSTYV